MKRTEAIAVLGEVKAKLGRNYKAAIRQAWMDGNYDGACLGTWAGQLQRIRNAFGPSWLVNAKVKRELPASSLACAVRGLIKLLDDGDLVRNTDGDGDAMVFMRQGIRISKALKAAQDALDAEALGQTQTTQNP